MKPFQSSDNENQIYGEWVQDEWKFAWAKAVSDVWADDNLKHQLLADPSGFLLTRYGFHTPRGLQLNIAENTVKTRASITAKETLSVMAFLQAFHQNYSAIDENKLEKSISLRLLMNAVELFSQEYPVFSGIVKEVRKSVDLEALSAIIIPFIETSIINNKTLYSKFSKIGNMSIERIGFSDVTINPEEFKSADVLLNKIESQVKQVLKEIKQYSEFFPYGSNKALDDLNTVPAKNELLKYSTYLKPFSQFILSSLIFTQTKPALINDIAIQKNKTFTKYKKKYLEILTCELSKYYGDIESSFKGENNLQNVYLFTVGTLATIGNATKTNIYEMNPYENLIGQHYLTEEKFWLEIISTTSSLSEISDKKKEILANSTLNRNFFMFVPQGKEQSSNPYYNGWGGLIDVLGGEIMVVLPPKPTDSNLRATALAEYNQTGKMVPFTIG